jgi:hypothetical protein
MKKCLFIVLLLVYSWHLSGQQKPFEIVLKPVSNVLMTETIQSAIDKCAAADGGIVRFTEGIYLAGGFQLKSKVTLHLEKGVVLQGSDKYADYKNDAFIYGKDISDIAIEGEGTIDGVDCYNPKGEEGFRGPHCIRLIGCKNLSFRGFTIKNSANWAFNLRYCTSGTVQKVSIRGGHDGLHTRFCSNFTVSECDFRTGDDSFAGNDNRDFKISDCKINTSCNGFRMGCYNLTVKHCKLWGPGEYSHKIQKRNNMLSAFVHFSPKDENPKLLSGNWLIEDCTVDQVDSFYNYNFENGLWQTGQPVTSVTFKKINAKGLLKAFSITGDKERQLQLTIKNSTFAFRQGSMVKDASFEGAKSASDAFFYVSDFGLLDLNNVTLQKAGKDVLFECRSGNKLVISGLHPDDVLSRDLLKDIKQIIK